MQKISYIIVSIIIFILAILLYVYTDITNIHKKNLLQNERLLLEYKHKTSGISSGFIKKILMDKNNTWRYSFASYAHIDEVYISSLSGNINFYTHGKRIIIQYKSDKYGWIQLISNNEFPNFKNLLLSHNSQYGMPNLNNTYIKL